MTALPPPPETPWQIFRDFVTEQAGDDAYVQWLVDSGTLERLGDRMTRPNDTPVPVGTVQWLMDVRHAYTTERTWHGQFQKLCEAFGVPPVLAMVSPGWEWPANGEWNYRWQPPSPALATAVLREAMDRDSFGDMAKHVHKHHPRAIAYRIRHLPEGLWITTHLPTKD